MKTMASALRPASRTWAMVAGSVFQPGTIGRQYSTTPVCCLCAAAVRSEVSVMSDLAIGSIRSSRMPL
ncbi:hypothetical protein KZZ52_33400 [Dactylosporangium sp. AC04546]|uniref:hypothetical protein n=1 Tax=Dactylosporangium sp. AC04546 TaxID=2862460 RepID=UPI001EE1047D|nr:hypothetical protein [Dactylosporangium sp. AC04546]WVK78875.1 hypothetical protein KZZ52_33400 [Dactylosporangium sp. AC04546]